MAKRFLALICALTLLVSAAPSAMALQGDMERAADTLYTLGLVKGTGDSLAVDKPASGETAAILLTRLAAGGATPDLTAVQAQAGVTANDWCGLLLSLLGYHAGTDYNAAEAALFARRIGLTALSYEGELTRGAMFRIALDALPFHYKGSGDTVMSRLLQSGAVSWHVANALGLATQEMTLRQAADRCLSAVFQLNSFETEDRMNANRPDSKATGFFIRSDGVAVTNHHSIERCTIGIATLVTGEKFPVERVIFYDEAMDIAVLKISQTSTEGKTVSAFATLEMVGTAEAQMGDTVYSIGNPLGYGLAVAQGVISDPRREVEGYTMPCVMNTADISEGSSGGALLNVYGRVVGVTSGAFTKGNSMFFAVPVEPVMKADLNAKGLTMQELADLAAAEAEKAQE